MKKTLFLAVLLCAVTKLSAQYTVIYTPEVLLGVCRAETVDSSLVDEAVRRYMETRVAGFQQSHLPQFIIAGRSNRFMLGIGGYVNFRTAYDFHGIVDNLDFVTADIPVPGTYADRQHLYMGASTSRLFFKALANTRLLGLVTAYIETDFRGSPEYNLRLRQAYIAFKGFLFGRNVTTFCDLTASPTTVDFEGPSSYNFFFNTMIRYSRDFGRHWSIGAALEMPSISGTYTDNLKSIPQRVPDLPVYAQYNFGRTYQGHIRLSGIFRDLFYYNIRRDESSSNFGWGVQLSGTAGINKYLRLFYQGVYGQGIAAYIQDIGGLGLDAVPEAGNPDRLQTLPMYGWFAAAQVNIRPNLFVSGGYSQVRVYGQDGYRPADQYRRAEYIFCNMFYHITPNLQTAVEYLHGMRKNMDGRYHQANRIQAMIQYNF